MFSRWYGEGTMDSHRLALEYGKVVFWLKTSTGTFIGLVSKSTFNDNNWHHVAGTYTSSSGTGTATLYVDGGVDVSSVTGSYEGLSASNITGIPTQLIIGSDDRGLYDRYFNGAISDVRIWNVTRTAPQIASSYQYRLNGTEHGLVGYWKLDQANTIYNGNTVTGFNNFVNANNSTSIQFASPLTWDTTIGFVPTPT